MQNIGIHDLGSVSADYIFHCGPDLPNEDRLGL